MNARGRTPVAIHPCRVKHPEVILLRTGMQNARSCTFLTKCMCNSREDDHSMIYHPQSPSLSTSSPTTRSLDLSARIGPPPELLVSSHVRVDSISRSNNKQQTCTHFARSNSQPAIQPSRLPGFASEAPALLQQALASTRGEQSASA